MRLNEFMTVRMIPYTVNESMSSRMTEKYHFFWTTYETHIGYILLSGESVCRLLKKTSDMAHLSKALANFSRNYGI